MAPIIFTSACSFWPWLNHEFFKGRTITIIFVLPGCFMKGNINSHHRLSFLPLIWGFFLPSSSSYFYSHLFLTFSHSVRSDSATPWTAAGQASLSITNSWSLLNSCPSSLWCHPTISSSVAPSPPAFNLSQHQGLFQWVSSLHQVAKVLGVSASAASFQWIFRINFLEDWLVWAPCSPRNSQESSPTPQFKSINSLALSLLYSPTLISYITTGKTIALTRWTFVGNVSAF